MSAVQVLDFPNSPKDAYSRYLNQHLYVQPDGSNPHIVIKVEIQQKNDPTETRSLNIRSKDEIIAFKELLEEKARDFDCLTELMEIKFNELQNIKGITKRLKYLKGVFDPDVPDTVISLDSFKSLILFLYAIYPFEKPSLTLDDEGFFYAKWKRDTNNSLAVRFEEDYFTEYVLFRPSCYSEDRIIDSNSIHLLDLKNYLDSLQISFHRYS